MIRRIAVTGLMVSACGLAGIGGLAGVPGAAAEEVRQQVLLDAQLSRFLYRWPLVGRSPEERAMVIDVLTEIWHGALHPTSPTSDS